MIAALVREVSHGQAGDQGVPHQIQSPEALIRLSGGEDHVDPVIVKIANAKLPARPEPDAS